MMQTCSSTPDSNTIRYYYYVRDEEEDEEQQEEMATAIKKGAGAMATRLLLFKNLAPSPSPSASASAYASSQARRITTASSLGRATQIITSHTDKWMQVTWSPPAVTSCYSLSLYIIIIMRFNCSLLLLFHHVIAMKLDP